MKRESLIGLAAFGSILVLPFYFAYREDPSLHTDKVATAKSPESIENELREERRGDCKYTIEGEMEAALKPLLRDPHSYEKIEFKTIPITDRADTYGAILEYRSKNGFGGYDLGHGSVMYDPDKCRITEIVGLQ